MAETNFTVRNDIKTPLEAIDALNHACAMNDFLQGALTLKSTDGITIDADESTGLFYIFQDIRDRINQATLILRDVSLNKSVTNTDHE